jgi:hypothetical protein
MGQISRDIIKTIYIYYIIYYHTAVELLQRQHTNHILATKIRILDQTQQNHKIMHSALKITFLIYFLTHIPITLLIDLQGNWGHLYPALLQGVVAWYVDNFKDFLMGSPPAWFRSFIVCEAFIQLPFFFFAIYALLYEKNWIRVPSLVYGAHVATTLFPIIAEFIASQDLNTTEKVTLISIYSPYLIVPIMLCSYMCFTETPFPSTVKSSVKLN